jgi:hypothetical protein
MYKAGKNSPKPTTRTEIRKLKNPRKNENTEPLTRISTNNTTTQLCRNTKRFRQMRRATIVFSENVEFSNNVRSDSNVDADSIKTDEIRNQTDIANAMRGASNEALLPLSSEVESVIPTTVMNSEEADHHGPRRVRTYLLLISLWAK